MPNFNGFEDYDHDDWLELNELREGSELTPPQKKRWEFLRGLRKKAKEKYPYSPSRHKALLDCKRKRKLPEIGKALLAHYKKESAKAEETQSEALTSENATEQANFAEKPKLSPSEEDALTERGKELSQRKVERKKIDGWQRELARLELKNPEDYVKPKTPTYKRRHQILSNIRRQEGRDKGKTGGVA